MLCIMLHHIKHETANIWPVREATNHTKFNFVFSYKYIQEHMYNYMLSHTCTSKRSDVLVVTVQYGSPKANSVLYSNIVMMLL